MFPTFRIHSDSAAKTAFLDRIQQASSQSAWGKRRLNRFKTVTLPSGKKKRMQLHATRGWKAA